MCAKLVTGMVAEKAKNMLKQSYKKYGLFFASGIKATISSILFLIMFASVLSAQNVTLRGVVSDQQTGESLVGATVSVQLIGEDNGIKGTASDNSGYYQISNINPGKYLFTVRFVGFEELNDTLTISGNSGVLLKNVQLKPSSEDLGEVVVSDKSTRGKVGQTRIKPESIGRVPAPSGTADLVNYIQMQPGVLVTGDRGGQLFVRGGTPSENMVLMDGTLIFQPFHIVGFFSVFPEDVVSSADFYAGGFGPRYSGRSSSVMDVRLKNGNLYEMGWSASVSPFISDVFFESPLAEGKSSVLVSARGSLIEESSSTYLQEQQPLKFNSQLIKYNSNSNTGVGCSALLMRTYDRGKLDFESDQYFKWSNVATGMRCAGASEGSSLSFIEMNFGLSYFSNEAGGVGAGTRNSNIFKSNLDLNLTQYINDIRIDYGFFTSYRTTNYDLMNRFISLEANEESFLTTGAFVNLEIPVTTFFSVESGVVATSYLRRLPTSLEPRFRFSVDLPFNLNGEFHGAAGMYNQPLVGLADFRDAGTAFTAWMLMPESERVLKNTHYLLGWQQSITNFFSFSLEAYHKDIKNTPVSVWSPIAEFSTELAYADGSVNGFDTRLDFSQRNFYASLGYGYSITEYETSQDHFVIWFGESIQKYNPPHDRRHQINAQMGFDIGNLSVNINWIYGSGMPYTRPMGFDSFFNFNEGMPEVTDEYGTPRILLDRPFDGKMPDFHRLDLSVEQKFQLTGMNMKVQLGTINTYNQKNLFYYDVFYQRGINQLPIVPYLSLKLESN